MGIIIREADVAKDQQVMIGTMQRQGERDGGEAASQARFTWAYLTNPHGKARAWLAMDGGSGKVIGFSAVLPRKMMVNNRELMAWNCADFCLDREYRPSEAATALCRALKDGVEAGEMALLYAHPRNEMLAYYEQAGHRPIGKMLHYAARLRLDKRVAKVLGDNVASRCLCLLANPVFTLSKRPGKPSERFDFAIAEEKKIGRDFDDLYERVALRHHVIACRDADYLAWRFGQHPRSSPQIFKMTSSVRSSGLPALRGYLIFTVKARVARIEDFAVDGGTHAMRELLAGFLGKMRRLKICAVSLRVHDKNPLLVQAIKLGFHCRGDGASTLIACAPQAALHAATVQEGRQWFITVGDV
jgi:hypothetical protein